LLAERHGFRGRREDYHHPDHTSLSRTLTRRAGLPLTLCAVYQAVARRAGLVAHLLPFPGHVLLEVREGGTRWILDPFDGGKILTARQCLLRLATLGIPFRERWLTAASDRDMLARQVHNLVHALGGARPHGAGHGPSHAPRVRGASRCELRLLEGTLEAFATPGPRK